MRVVGALSFFRNSSLFCSRCFFYCKQKAFSNFPSSNTSNCNSELYDDLVKEVQKYRRELRNHFKSSLRHRYLVNSIENLNKGFCCDIFLIFKIL